MAKQTGLIESFSKLRSDYAASTEGRFRRRRPGIQVQGSDADYHYGDEGRFFKTIEYARDMDRNDAVVGQMIDRAVSNMIQDGVKLDTQTGDPKLDQDLWARWQAWATNPDQCDLSGELCWHDIEQLVPRQAMVDGDMVVLPVLDGPIQLVEAHRIRTPRNTRQNVVHGVLLDDRRKRLEYWVTKDDISTSRAVSKVSEVLPYKVRDKFGYRQVFHIYNPKRVSQTRGVTALAPMFDLCGMFEDINFAKVVQQQIVSCFAVFRQRDLGSNINGTQQLGAREDQTLIDGSRRTLEGIGPGMVISGEPGETLQGFSPTVPNPEFFDHIKLILTLIGVNIGLPLNLVLLDPSDTNFSGWRGAIDQARLGFRRNQNWLVNRLHEPVYKWKVRQWISEDRALQAASLRKGIDIFGHKWNLPTWPYIEPEKDSRAFAYRVRTGQISPRRAHAEDGRDYEEIVLETVEDNGNAIVLAKKRAMQINGQFDDDQPVHWRDLLSMAPPEGTTAKLGETPEPEPEPIMAGAGNAK